jgi:hypothetical protein
MLLSILMKAGQSAGEPTLFAGGFLGTSDDNDTPATTVGFRFLQTGQYDAWQGGVAGFNPKGFWLTGGGAELFEIKVEYQSGDTQLNPGNLSTWFDLGSIRTFSTTNNPSGIYAATYSYEIREILDIGNNVTGTFQLTTEDLS